MKQFENTVDESHSRQYQSTFDRYVSRQDWVRLDRVSELVDRVRSRQSIVCFCTAASCFVCKLVEPKVAFFPSDLDFCHLDFYTIDVDAVADANLLPDEVTTLPTILLYRDGKLQDCVQIGQARPARALAQGIKRVFG